MPLTPIDPAKRQLLDAILTEVPFDGWSQKAFDRAVASSGLTREQANALCPRGAVDLAVAYHQSGDAALVAAIRAADLSGMKFRDKVAFALRARIDAISDKECVRRGSALFALPHLAADGARLIWGTADLIWETLGDTSQDINWYTKRATLSGVYATTILFWLGDQSTGATATNDFIARRIDNVMQFEKLKGQVNDNRMLKPLTDPLHRLFGWVKAPNRTPAADLPGSWTGPR